MTDYTETMRRQVEEMPRLRFVCERDWMRGPNAFAIGIMWNRKFNAEPGEFIYQRRLMLHWSFYVSTDIRLRAPQSELETGK